MEGNLIFKELADIAKNNSGLKIPVRLYMPNYGIAGGSEKADSFLLDSIVGDVFDNTIFSFIDPIRFTRLLPNYGDLAGQLGYDLRCRTGMIVTTDFFDGGKRDFIWVYSVGVWQYEAPSHYYHNVAASNFAESHVYDLAAQMSRHF